MMTRAGERAHTASSFRGEAIRERPERPLPTKPADLLTAGTDGSSFAAGRSGRILEGREAESADLQRGGRRSSTGSLVAEPIPCRWKNQLDLDGAPCGPGASCPHHQGHSWWVFGWRRRYPSTYARTAQVRRCESSGVPLPSPPDTEGRSAATSPSCYPIWGLSRSPESSRISSSSRNRTEFTSMRIARLMRRPPDSDMPRQFLKDSAISL